MIYLASDHGGFQIKQKIKNILTNRGVKSKDLGPFTLKTDDDYPDYILPMAELVTKENAEGIIACRNGQGAAIAANKVKGARAVVCWNGNCVESARNDDNANILSIPADYITDLELETLIDRWLETPFSNDARHIRRIGKVTDYELAKRSR